MNFSDNLATIIYLKKKLHRWKNISYFFLLIIFLLFFKVTFGSAIINDNNLVGEEFIANIKIEDVIVEDSFRSETLKKIAEEKNVKAVIVEIDSPGGTIVGSEILFNDLRKIANSKPMVVVMNSVAASGGYMAAVASNHIIAHNGTLTGSIGVIMESPEVTKLADKIGVKMDTYKSSPLKGSPSMFEKKNDLVNSVMQESINDSYQFFSDLVKERRGDKIDKKFYNTVFDGRVFTGRQALKFGLIDEVGSKDNAISYLKSQGIDTEKLDVIDIKTIKEENQIVKKIFNFSSLINNAKRELFESKIMAIMK